MFIRRIPKTVKGSPYPNWVEVKLTEEEAANIMMEAKEQHKTIFKFCIEDAKQILEETNIYKLEDAPIIAENIIQVAVALFDKRASHVVFAVEKECESLAISFTDALKEQTKQIL